MVEVRTRGPGAFESALASVSVANVATCCARPSGYGGAASSTTQRSIGCVSTSRPCRSSGPRPESSTSRGPSSARADARGGGNGQRRARSDDRRARSDDRGARTDDRGAANDDRGARRDDRGAPHDDRRARHHNRGHRAGLRLAGRDDRAAPNGGRSARSDESGATWGDRRARLPDRVASHQDRCASEQCGAIVTAIDARGATRDARGMTRASRRLTSASREVIDLCQPVPPRAPFETSASNPGKCAAQKAPGAALVRPRPSIHACGQTLPAPSSSRLTTRASIATTRAALVTTRASLGASREGGRGPSHVSRHAECVAPRASRDNRHDGSADRRYLCVNCRGLGIDRRDLGVDRQAERRSRARFSSSGCATGGPGGSVDRAKISARTETCGRAARDGTGRRLGPQVAPRLPLERLLDVVAHLHERGELLLGRPLPLHRLEGAVEPRDLGRLCAREDCRPCARTRRRSPGARPPCGASR